MAARHVTSETFEREVLQSSRPSVVDFYADWCGPCRAMGPVVDELADELGDDANVVKINVDEAPELANRYGVQSIPAFVIIRDGDVVDTRVGVQSKQVLAAALNEAVA